MESIDEFNVTLEPCASIYSARIPEIYGVAIDVPESMAYEPKSIGYVDRILPPGAETSGLIFNPYVGDHEENVLMVPPVILFNEEIILLLGVSER